MFGNVIELFNHDAGFLDANPSPTSPPTCPKFDCIHTKGNPSWKKVGINYGGIQHRRFGPNIIQNRKNFFNGLTKSP